VVAALLDPREQRSRRRVQLVRVDEEDLRIARPKSSVASVSNQSSIVSVYARYASRVRAARPGRRPSSPWRNGENIQSLFSIVNGASGSRVRENLSSPLDLRGRSGVRVGMPNQRSRCACAHQTRRRRSPRTTSSSYSRASAVMSIDCSVVPTARRIDHDCSNATRASIIRGRCTACPRSRRHGRRLCAFSTRRWHRRQARPSSHRDPATSADRRT